MKNLFLMTLALLVGASQSFATADSANCKDEAHYPLMDKKELQGHVQKNDVFLVDVNSAKSFQEHHIGNAVHFGAHEKDFAKVLPADKNSLIVAYCGNEMCTAWKKAAQEACAKGYTNIKHFKPGIQGWVKN